jgi:hypothetical protein
VAKVSGHARTPLIPVVLETPVRRGHARACDVPALQLRHIRAAYQYLVAKRTAREVARDFGCHHTTILNWSKLALTYDTPEAEGLRRLVGHETNGGGEVIENA